MIQIVGKVHCFCSGAVRRLSESPQIRGTSPAVCGHFSEKKSSWNHRFFRRNISRFVHAPPLLLEPPLCLFLHYLLPLYRSNTERRTAEKASFPLQDFPEGKIPLQDFPEGKVSPPDFPEGKFSPLEGKNTLAW